MAKVFYDDGVYSVSSAIVSTPRRFYPLANTTASLRRDPLWVAIGVTMFEAACIAVYGDLLYPGEYLILAAVALVVWAAGLQVALLRIDAIGHKPAIIFGAKYRLQKLFEAIRQARSIEGPIHLYSEN